MSEVNVVAKRTGAWWPLAFVAVVFGTTMYAQQKSTPSNTSTRSLPARKVEKPGVVSGRVFLITKAGDLKPARLAQTFMLYSQRNVTLAEMTEAEIKQEKAVVVWLHAHIKAMQADMQAMRAEPLASDSATCHRRLSLELGALQETLQWAKDNPTQSGQIISSTADEEGNFEMSAPPGRYLLLAQGRAGFYDALWTSGTGNEVIVEPGKTTTIKIASTETACLNSN